ncbi:MAG TPA: DUF3341 domain-containing protein [Gemmatimonadales bacterium]|jgi:hypothetical protein
MKTPQPARHVIAEFGDDRTMIAGLGQLASAGFRDVTSYGPWDLPAVDAIVAPERPPIAGIATAGGVVGGLIGLALQWWSTGGAYPVDIGGRPRHPLPAFIPVTFEATILGAALAVFIGWLVILRYPRLWAPIDEIEGFEHVTTNRFWISVGIDDDAAADAAAGLLESAGARRVGRAQLA